MRPDQKIKQAILLLASEWSKTEPPEITEDNIDRLFYETEDLEDCVQEVREGQVETDIESEYSRYYESKSVASQMADGSWVGWTHWYGGGKHGEPWAVEWISEAYDLNCVEEEKLVMVRTFTVNTRDANEQ